MKKSVLILMTTLLTFSAMALDFTDYGDEVGNAILSKGTIGKTVEVIEKEVCAFREALTPEGRFYSLEFDFLGYADEFPFQFVFDKSEITKLEIDKKIIFTKTMSSIHSPSWKDEFSRNVCLEGESASTGSMSLVLDSGKTMSISWNAECEKDNQKVNRFYQLKCTKGEVEF